MLFTSVLLLVSFAKVYSDCEHTFMTFCDDLMDLNKNDVEQWTEVVIGKDSKKSFDEMYSIDEKTIPLDLLEKCTTMVIIGQIKDIKRSSFYLDPDVNKMDNLLFYGNNLRRLRAEIFDNIILRKLSLKNNNIEYIHKNTFYYCELQTIDLSNNRLELIEKDTFSEEFLGNATRELIFRHNNLGSIEPGSFPSSLEILNLDYNNLLLATGKDFRELVNLRELTISHNRIATNPNLSNLTELQIVDLSYNNLQAVTPQYLLNLPRLEVLDLSHNKLAYPYTLCRLKFPVRRPPLQISLAFNRLTHLLLNNNTIGGHKIILYGNPWSCNCWSWMEKFFSDNKFKMHNCDKEFFGTGQTPYCLYNEKELNCTEFYLKTPPYADSDYTQFLRVIDDNKKNINCNLNPKRQ